MGMGHVSSRPSPFFEVQVKDLPNPFWAFLFILSACIVAVLALFAHDKTDTASVITLAMSIVTGAFGYIQGHRDGKASAEIPSEPSALPNPEEKK